MMLKANAAVSRLRAGLVANYALQLYTAFIGIALLPFFLRHLGPEAYGLIGFLALLQALLQLLDFGVCGTMAREAARHRGGAITAEDLLRHFRKSERFLVLVASAVAISLALGSQLIVTEWLRPQELASSVARPCLVIIALILPLRWMSIFYRSLLSGFEQQVWLATFGSAIATIRSVLVLPIVIYDGSIINFFLFQLGVAMLETGVLWFNAHLRTKLDLKMHCSTAPLVTQSRERLSFSILIGLTAILSVIVVQTDKIFLSTKLPLSDYGQFTLAIALAGAIHLLASPVGTVTQPRLTWLFASNLEKDAIALYRQSTQILCVILAPIAITLIAFSEETLYAWVGDAALSHRFAIVLAMYAAGNVTMAIAGMPYLLLFAQGKPRIDTLGMLLLSIILVPTMYIAVASYGALGAGLTWMSAMFLYLFAWTPLVHRLYARRFHIVWLLDIATVFLPAVLTVGALRALAPDISGRGSMGAYILMTLTISFIASAAACPFARGLFVDAVRASKLARRI